MKCLKNRKFILTVAILLGFFHYAIAVTLIFYGSVIDPSLSHQTMNIIGLLMMLPLGPIAFLNLFPFFSVIIGFLNLALWIFIYYKTIESLCIKKSNQ